MSEGNAVEANKAAFRRGVEEIWNAGRLEAIEALIDPGFRRHHPRDVDQDLRGLDALRSWIAGVRAALPDLRVTIERLFAENDRVMARVRVEGTHRGDLAGIVATGRPLVLTATALCRFTEGRVHECWLIADEVGALRQMGGLPSPG